MTQTNPKNYVAIAARYAGDIVSGKIWIDWNDFQSWLRRLRVEIRQDNPVVDILRDLARKRSGY
jgi:hypothetical protein